MCNDDEEYIVIHSDYSKLPKDRILNQIVYDLEHAKRELYSDDFPQLDIVNNLIDINVEFDATLAKNFYLRMADCFAEEEYFLIKREFPFLDENGFTLPCDYRDAIYGAIGFKEGTRPASGCPYCPYESSLDKKCQFCGNYSPKRKVFYINEIISLARSKFNVENPTEKQYNYVVSHFGDFHSSWNVNLKWLNYRASKLLWKKAYTLLAHWPIREGVKIKGGAR